MSQKEDNPAATGSSEASFEESLARLEEIVAELEEGAPGLKVSIEKFEQAMTLLRSCYQTLEQAEQKIEQLTSIDEAGNVSTRPFDATATADRSEKQPHAGPSKKSPGKSHESESSPLADEPNEKRLF